MYFVCMYVCMYVCICIVVCLGRELHIDKINQFMMTDCH
jgi:hypothetical protein